MKLTAFLSVACVAAVCTAFNTTIVRDGISYDILNVYDEDVTCSRRKRYSLMTPCEVALKYHPVQVTFTKEQVAHFVTANAGVKDHAKLDFPRHAVRNMTKGLGFSDLMPDLVSEARNNGTFGAPIVIKDNQGMAWMDDGAEKHWRWDSLGQCEP